jgi:hypothetical protein
MTHDELLRAERMAVEKHLADLDVQVGAEELPALIAVYNACRGAARFIHGVPVARTEEPAVVFRPVA